LTPFLFREIMPIVGFGMLDFRRTGLKNAIAAVALSACLLVSGCMGARGWPSGVVSDGTLYVGSMQGRIVALNADSGVRIWEWEREKEDDIGGFLSCGAGAGQFAAGSIYGAPQVADGVVYFGGYDGGIYAVDAEGGANLWSYELEGTIVGGVAVGNDALYVGCSDGNLYALDIGVVGSQGRLKEGFVTAETGDKVWARPLVHDGIVYFGSLDHKLYAVDGDTGEPVWDAPFETGGGIGSTALIVDGVLYVGSFDSKFYAVDAATGQEIWALEAGNWFWSDPVYRDGIVYACSLDYNVYAIDAETGEIASSWPGPFDTGAEVKSSPVIVDDLLVVASEDGKIYGLDLTSGAKEWEEDVEAKVGSSLVASDGTLHINAQDGKLYTFTASTGRQKWSVALVD
jgi:outer membrane protein assembly factor BamB